MKQNERSLFGPGFLVTAAFVGPGTIATASKAGSSFEFALLWAVGFAVVATILLQEMTARLGVVTGQGLGESLRATFPSAFPRFLVFTLVIVAILIGNSAFQAGNITGASSGIAGLVGIPFRWIAVPIAIVAWLLLMSGKFKLIQNVLVFFVVLMSILFIISAIIAKPDWGLVLQGLVVPNLPAESIGIAIALIGTTVVPYNLFLHSSSAANTWGNSPDPRLALSRSRLDLIISILIGGLITASIVITAAVTFADKESSGNLQEIAKQLEPSLGFASHWLLGIGLFSAGLTSAITAPLAAAYAISGCLGWSSNLADRKFKIVFSAVILFGLIGCLVFADGRSPAQLIVVAQIANGMLLPIVAIILLIVMNNQKLLGDKINGLVGNVLGVVIVLLTSVWGLQKIAAELIKIVSK
ncbi:MAG TPA: Nramp family divalent metal transporter [Pirellulaceae bacterium]|nr:Nramp family divalent metal transporter [Pirellulaceae bacterium]HMO90601.1 Nramp family divalent metal transporter [Pirellulaceae bacterium]HMP67820.1 Nramp family divalent metal transporter [Pirellulaceae bacterium]